MKSIVLILLLMIVNFSFSQSKPLIMLDLLSSTTFEESFDILSKSGFTYGGSSENNSVLYERSDMNVMIDTLENSYMLRLPFEKNKYNEIIKYLVENGETVGATDIDNGTASLFNFNHKEWILYDVEVEGEHLIILIVTKNK